MSYVVLARKWRPTRFADLVGQEHVAKTLENAIASGRLAHAFLFTGVRGVGKTTSARLLARSLNCLGTQPVRPGEPDPGPTATPCLECSACREITAGNDVDVREIDGASYNGVDEVRKLQESLPYRPSRDRYKVYIIDEVHMLSQSAWNAFLKTLEEPPAHVKFIFATTEVHKVPVTILSRVQRFDFKLISARQIVDRLRQVLEGEGIRTDDAALSIIARQAAGSMRDAMSLLDQVIAWNDAQLDGESVARVLGVASRRILHDLAERLVNGDAAGCLGIINDVANQGFDLPHVARDILELLRDLVVARVCATPDDLLDLPAEEKADVTALSGGANLDDLLRLYQGFSAGFDDVTRSGQPRSALEMLLVRLARRPPLLPIDDLVGRLMTIERRLAGASGSIPAGRPARGPSAEAPAPAELESLPRAPAPSAGTRSAPTPRSGPRPETPPLPTSFPPAAPVIPITPHVRRAPTAPTQRPHPANATAEVLSLSSNPPPDPARAEDELLAEWQELVERVATERPEVAAVLEHATLLAADSRLLEIGWPKGSVFPEQFPTSLVSELVGRADSARPGSTPRVISVLTDDARTVGRQTLAERETAERARQYRARMAEIRNHPSVRDAIEVLGARLRDIRLKA